MTDSSARSGPSIETYVETRFNLLLTSMTEKLGASDAALLAFVEATRASALAVKSATEAASAATDLRYQQRFEAQTDALAAAFQSQQTAMATALVVAEKAVQAALASADRAVSKAEAAADKRFETLNELRQTVGDMAASHLPRIEAVQRFDALTEKIDAVNRRIDTMEARLNLNAGEAAGGRQSRGDTKALIATTVAIVSLLVTVALALMRMTGK